MSDVRAIELAGRQFNRISRGQLLQCGLDRGAVEHRVGSGRLVIVEPGVFAFAPVLDDKWGRWMGATLTERQTVLSRLSAAVAYEILGREGRLITVTRPGDGGPVRHGGLWVHRSTALAGDITELHGVPITTVARTALDLASDVNDRAYARAVREALRLGLTTIYELGDALGRYQGRRGSKRFARMLARYSGLPIERARSGAEIRATQLLRDAGISGWRLNVDVAGEEADLSFPARRLIIEVDGGPFHLDKGEDKRKEIAWRAAGWIVRRLPSDDVYDRPRRFLDLCTK